MKTLLAVAALSLAAALPDSAVAQQRLPSDSMEIGATYTRWLLDGEVDSLVSVMTEEFLTQAGGAEGIQNVMATIAERAGEQTEVLETKYVTRNGNAQYWHTAEFSTLPEPLQIRWVINRDGMIAAAGLNPLSQAPPIDADIEP